MNTFLQNFTARVGRRLSGTLLAGALLLTGRAAQAQVDNYNFAPSVGTFTALPATATAVPNIQADDVLSANIPLGFTFAFDGTPYTSCEVSSNGWLTFNTAATGSSLTNELATGIASERPRVAPYWDDLNGISGTASYLTTGTAPNRVFTFQWLNWIRYSNTTGPSFSMQVQLTEGTNVVRFVYRQEPGAISGASASIGLSGTGTGSGSFLSLSDATGAPNASSTTEASSIATLPATGQIYTFTPPVPSACPTPRNLTSSVTGTTATVNWTVVSGGGTFSVIYGPTGFNPATGGTTVGPFTTPTANIPGLIPGSYQFYVRQNCAGSAGNSNLSSSGGFSVPCPTPTALTATNLTNTTATLTWASPVTTGATFTVVYGVPGFDPLSGGTRVTGINATTYTLTSLLPATNYVFYVIQACQGGSNSATPGGPISFTTPLTAPNNDEPCGAIALGNTTISATNSGATTSVQNGITFPACSPSQVPKDVWYTITPSGTSTTLTFTGSAAGMVRVFTSPSCSAGPFTQVFCQSSGANNTTVGTVGIPGLTPGTRYYISISGFGSGDTPGTFTLAGTNLLATKVQTETNALVVYPNPSNTGQLTLRLNGLGGTGQATLLNALGQVVLAKALAGTAEQTLSTHGLAAGLYTLRVAAAGQVLTRKVVLE